MYRYSNGQNSLLDFKQPVGMNLKESNRWVKKAQIIPWTEIEKRYAALFTNRKGNVAKPLRLALGTCIIQAEYGYSDEETALQIQENPYRNLSWLMSCAAGTDLSQPDHVQPLLPWNAPSKCRAAKASPSSR